MHHTATSNGYAQADVPAMIRSMYKYHTHSLGWSDIAYNFLIDNYGTIWEGRYGGVDQPVRGAHTLGFNNSSTGFSMIGNYDSAPAVERDARPRWPSWPPGSSRCTAATPGAGPRSSPRAATSSPRARWSRCPVIDGHRDTNDTACPGGNVYAQLDDLRAATAGVIAASMLKLKKPFRVKGDDWLGGTLGVVDGKFKPKDAAVTYQWTRNGVAIDGAVGSSYVVTRGRHRAGRRRGRDRQRGGRPAGLPDARPARAVPVGARVLGAHPAQAGRQGDRAPRGHRARRRRARRHGADQGRQPAADGPGRRRARRSPGSSGCRRVATASAASTPAARSSWPARSATGSGSRARAPAPSALRLRNRRTRWPHRAARGLLLWPRFRSQPPKTSGLLPLGVSHPRGTNSDMKVGPARARMTLESATGR